MKNGRGLSWCCCTQNGLGTNYILISELIQLKDEAKFVIVYPVESRLKSRAFHMVVDKSREFGYRKLDESERVQRACQS